MKFQDHVLRQIGERIAQLGLTNCPVFQSETISIGRQPIIVNVGGVPGGALQDAKTNILFLIALNCELCGRVMMFNSETHSRLKASRRSDPDRRPRA